MLDYYEFFAGGGMARLGLGKAWNCLFANDFDPKKAASYQRNHGHSEMQVGDIAQVQSSELKGKADLAWASFPCQDLSLAGQGQGLDGARSGTFWAFWQLMDRMRAEGRQPSMIALENVCGAITSNKGRDFAELISAVGRLGYRVGGLVIDAAHFVPQSRPRLFILAVAPNIQIPPGLARPDPSSLWHPRNLVEAKFTLPKAVQDQWIWWNLALPPDRQSVFADLIEADPQGVAWNADEKTQALLTSMSPLNQQKVKAAQRSGRPQVGALYKRTRGGVVRAEVRFDDIAGCLRTPSGGSSRQTILAINGSQVRSRLLSSREAGRLMGLPEEYELPANYNDAYHLVGDGLVVPAVAHLAEHLITPIALANHQAELAFAA